MTAELQKIDALIAEVEKVILGKRDVIQFTVLCCLLADTFYSKISLVLGKRCWSNR